MGKHEAEDELHLQVWYVPVRSYAVRIENLDATFQRLVENIWSNLTSVKCYVDDVVTRSATAESHV